MKLSPQAKRKTLTVLVVSIVVVLAGIVGILGWEFSNSNTFCAVICHNVHPEESYAHKASQHAKVTCVECHMGRLPMLKIAAVKVTHSAHLWGMIAGYERPLTSPSMPASRKSCEGCHAEQSHLRDSVLVRKHYEPNEANTETTIQLTLRTGPSWARKLGGKGVHWHLGKENQVRFIAIDEQNLNIPWVESTEAGGKTVVYTDVTQPLTNEEIAQSEKKVMECIDCHNRVGHPFLNPETVVDNALAQGYLDRRFPFIKARLVNLLQQEYASEEEALDLVEEASAQYQKDFPNIPEEYPEDYDRFKEFARERRKAIANWLVRSKFRHPGVSWQSFQDMSGHKYTPGCFRCHNGKHLDEEGNPISVNCTTCHNVPFIKKERDPAFWQRRPFGDLKPKSHKQPDFILEHKNLIGESCKSCHQEIKYGTDNKTFCANPACHATEWPGLDMKARRIKKTH